MQTLSECYKEIAQNHSGWSYYDNPPNSIEDVWNDANTAYRFIRDYFGYAGKSEVFNDKNIETHQRFIEERAPHIISTFLLGIKIAESFNLATDERDSNNMNFFYYWFLTCLYHDIGYAYENNHNCERLKMVREDGIEALHEICRLQYLHQRTFRTYPHNIVDFYLKCRADCRIGQPKLDHGIIGGLLLYDKLRKQFTKAWKKRTDKSNGRDSFYVIHEGTGRRLHLSNSHYEAYAKAADAIITHNIWPSTLQDYIERFADNSLRLNAELKIRFIDIENLFCFILSLSDTIEPLKRGLGLDSIRIESLPEYQGFCLQVSKDDFDSIYSRIKSLEDWMSVKVNIEDTGNGEKKITFTLPN